jgi:hypothetical protein
VDELEARVEEWKMKAAVLQADLSKAHVQLQHSNNELGLEKERGNAWSEVFYALSATPQYAQVDEQSKQTGKRHAVATVALLVRQLNAAVEANKLLVEAHRPWRILQAPDDEGYVFQAGDEISYSKERTDWAPLKGLVGNGFTSWSKTWKNTDIVVRTRSPRPVKTPETYRNNYASFSYCKAPSYPGGVFEQGVEATGGVVAK